MAALRRRLSSFVAPFTMPPPLPSPNRTVGVSNSSDLHHPSTDLDVSFGTTRLGTPPRSQSLPTPYTINLNDLDDDRSFAETSSRRSFDMSEVASRRSYDMSEQEGSGSEYTESGSEFDSEDEEIAGDKYDLMTSHIYQVAEGHGWFRSRTSWGIGGGIVSIRVKKREFRTYPIAHRGQRGEAALRDSLDEWETAVTVLNPEVAIKITSKVVQSIMARAPIEATEVVIDVNTRIQILDEMPHLAGARKHQFAAFIREEGCLAVWADEVETIIESAQALEQRMIQFVWAGRHDELEQVTGILHDENKKLEAGVGVALSGEYGDEKRERDLGVEEEEIGKHRDEMAGERRPVMLYAPLVTGLAIFLNSVFVASGVRQLVKETLLDGKFLRFTLLATVPFGFWLSMFFCICVMGNLWQTFGPVAHCRANGCYYSGAPPKRMTGKLPHITIQMPVYKEGLEGVIIPTVESLKKAITTYERQGGTVNIFICDDGMQLWDPEEAAIRQAYYERNVIGWVARPKHGKDGFIRKGRFKKASNMNFANRVSLRVEEIMDELRPERPSEELDWVWTQEDEDEIYEEALARAIEESNGIAWAAGNIRIGEIILIIDSDTRVPEDCFLDAASELAASPQVAVIQHESAVMQVIGHYFENGITSFTERINSAISFCCANGEVAPFVGHNAFLRWSAVQDAAFIDEDDGILKNWSESHVSEDFDLSLRLQMKGWTMRWASYSNGGFQEGVSLTAPDELNRWQKYAYGCSELLFQPLRKWPTHGPITELFNRFMWSNIPIHSKISVLAYISSYYAIACATALSTANWVLVGLFADYLDKFYLSSWNVFLSCVVIFCGLSNVSSAIFQYRLKQNTLGAALWGNFKWLFFFFFFFCGMSWHLSNALLAHLIGYNMTWGSTVKEVDFSNFFKEVPLILDRFWQTYIMAFGITIVVIIMGTNLVPVGYQITNFTCILPVLCQTLGHIFYPIVLNPWLMMFSF